MSLEKLPNLFKRLHDDYNKYNRSIFDVNSMNDKEYKDGKRNYNKNFEDFLKILKQNKDKVTFIDRPIQNFKKKKFLVINYDEIQYFEDPEKNPHKYSTVKKL